MTRPVTSAGTDLTKRFEKCVLVCYSTDGSNTPSIGYGHTKGLSKADVGVKRISEEQAEILLENDYADAAIECERQLGADVIAAMTQNQYDAIVDAYFNLGSFKDKPDHPEADILKVLRAKRFDAVPAELDRYVYAKGVKELGLVRRRNAEKELWATGEPGAAENDLSSADTRTLSTPPAPSVAATQPLHQSKSFLASCAAAVCTAGAAASPYVGEAVQGLQSVQNQLDPIKDANHHVAVVYSAVASGVTALILLAAGAEWLKHRAAVQQSAGAPNNVAKPVAQ